MKRILSLALVLVLLLQLFALPAQAAVTGTGLLIGASAISVVATALISLGVLPGSDGNVFDGLVNDAVSYLASLGIGDGSTIPVLKYLGSNGNIKYALQTAVFTALRSWLFSTSVLSAPASFSTSFTYTIWSGTHTVSNSNPFLPVLLLAGNGSSILYFVSVSGLANPIVLDGSDIRPQSSNYHRFGNGYLGYFFGSYSAHYLDSSGVYVVYADSYSDITVDFSSVSSVYDVTLFDVAPENEDLSVAYPSWGVGSVEIPGTGDDDQPDPFIPITLLPTYDETKSQTQEQAQSGQSTLETDNSGTSVDISGDVGGSITPDDGSGDLPGGGEYPTVSDLTTMFAWLASSIDRSIELLFPDLQVIKTYLKTLAAWEDTKNGQMISIISYLTGFDTDFDTMLSNLGNIDLNMTSLVSHAQNSVSILSGMASDLKDIRDVIADPLDADINESQKDNKTAFLDNFGSKSQSENIGDLAGLSGGMTDFFQLPDVDISSMFDQVESGFGQWFTSETAQAISVGGGAAAVGVSLMDEAEYVPPETPYLDAWTQEVQDILSGGD